MTNKSSPTIHITDNALNKLFSFQELMSENKLLRISVQQGGCSGMSYIMDFENKNKIKKTDEVINYDHFQIICDSKSLLYIYGMSLDYKNALVGGGFQFINPNAVQVCGCGKSFSV